MIALDTYKYGLNAFYLDWFGLLFFFFMKIATRETFSRNWVQLRCQHRLHPAIFEC